VKLPPSIFLFNMNQSMRIDLGCQEDIAILAENGERGNRLMAGGWHPGHETIAHSRATLFHKRIERIKFVGACFVVGSAG
jgi:hypothetical protein